MPTQTDEHTMKEPHVSMQSTAACKHTSPFGHPCGKGCLHENRTSGTRASTTRVNWLMHHAMHAGCHTKCAIGLKPHAQKPSECTGRFLQEGPSRTRNGQFAARYMQARMPAETVQKTQKGAHRTGKEQFMHQCMCTPCVPAKSCQSLKTCTPHAN